MNRFKLFGFVFAGIALVIAGCSVLEPIGDGLSDLFGGDYAVVETADPNATVGSLMASPTGIPSTLFDAGMKIATGFVPALAGWEAMLALFFKRKRKHYVKAFKAAMPLDKNVDLGGALAGITAALGVTHSSSSTQEVFEEEEEME